jgi:hypothetical protein
MTQSQLQNIIKEGENISVEFKKCSTENQFGTLRTFIAELL